MKTLRSAALAAVPATFVAVFFAYPVLTLLVRGLGQNADGVFGVVTGERSLKIVWFTIWPAAANDRS